MRSRREHFENIQHNTSAPTRERERKGGYHFFIPYDICMIQIFTAYGTVRTVIIYFLKKSLLFLLLFYYHTSTTSR